jgi:UDP-3-O-[3-hydroxymyristoyl] glucosamine N-acyltransferase
MTLGELVNVLGGKLVAGELERPVNGVNSVELAGEAELVFAEDAASAAKALASGAEAVIVRSGSGPLCSPTLGSDEATAKDGAPSVEDHARYPKMGIVETEQPRLWFARAAKLLKPAPAAAGVHPTAVIGEHVGLGEGVSIGPCAIVGENAHIGARTRIEAGAVVGEGVQIGEECRIYPRVVIYPGTTLGNRVIVHAGAVLGADGFGYVRDSATGAYTQFPQQGTLVIEDDVEIGANSTIDRGALRETRIGRGTKIDNLVHVGHNCEIGEDVILVAGVGISGSSSVGDGAVIAGQVGIGDHAHVGPGVILGGQAGVLNGKTVTNEGLGVKPGTVLWGTPARPLKQVLREIAVLARLAKKGPGTKGLRD